MDIDGKHGRDYHRHPWELSRYDCISMEIYPYLSDIYKKNKAIKYISVGAGDAYLDRAILQHFPNAQLTAVDIGYKNLSPKGGIKKYRELEDIEEKEKYDCAAMWDSLCCIEDDNRFLGELVKRINVGGYIFLALPAFNFMRTSHDIDVDSYRRYDKKTIKQYVRSIEGLKLLDMHYFFFSLFVFRLFQILCRIPVDPKHQSEYAWKYGRKNPITLFIRTILDFDYLFCKKAKGIMPGLSLMVILHKEG